MRVTAPADKRLRRAHLKPSRRSAVRRHWRGRAAAAIITAGVVFYAAERLMRIVADLEGFHVEHIVVRGNQRLSSGEALALLHGLRGESILSADLHEWRLAMLNSPWVADAALRRKLPSTIEVTIQERAPLAIARLGATLYLVDDTGTVIDDYNPSYADLDLPIIDGLSSLPGDETSNVYRAVLVRRLLDSLRGRNMAGQISEIDVSDARNAIVLLKGDPTQVRLGSERFVERLQSYFELAPALRESVPAIDYVDLRFDGRVYVRPARQKSTPPARPSAAPAKGVTGMRGAPAT